MVFKNDQILRFSVELTAAFRFQSFRCEAGSHEGMKETLATQPLRFVMDFFL